MRISASIGSLAPVPIFTTNFPSIENPLSQGAIWTNGGTTGLDWTNVQTTTGLAFATQVAHGTPPFDDSIACLSGYVADQWCSGKISNPSNAATLREVELHLRQTITSHSAVSYEIDITTAFGLQIVKWNGPSNSFTPIASNITTNVTTNDGDLWYAQIQGSTILVKCNGTTVYTGTDSAITSGSPGVGFYSDTTNGTPTANNSFGFSIYSAGHL